MQLTDEVNWTVLDFVVQRLFFTWYRATVRVHTKKVKQTKYRIAICSSSSASTLIWAELAVGILEQR
jgi:hypothetical protein